MTHRPSRISGIIGQESITHSLKTKAMAFFRSNRTVAVDHMLFAGPSGLGKTTLAQVFGVEIGVRVHSVMAHKLRSMDDIMRLFASVRENEIVFIDEIHALPNNLQEVLYGLMEDFRYEVIGRSGVQTVSVPRFTLIGATTHAGVLSAPLRQRFGMIYQLQPYTVEQLIYMVQSAALRIYSCSLSLEVSTAIAHLSQRTARRAYKLLSDLMTQKMAASANDVTMAMLHNALYHASIDPVLGLDYTSRRYLVALSRQAKGVGLKALAALTNEQPETLSDMVEPFLLGDTDVKGNGYALSGPLVELTPRGRVITATGREYLNLMNGLKVHQWFVGEKFV